MALLDSAYKFIMELFFLTFILFWLMQSCCNFTVTSLKLWLKYREERSKTTTLHNVIYNNESGSLSNRSYITILRHIGYLLHRINSYCVVLNPMMYLIIVSCIVSYCIIPCSIVSCNTIFKCTLLSSLFLLFCIVSSSAR